MSGTYEHTELTAEQKAALQAYKEKLETALQTPDRERDGAQGKLVSEYLRKLDEAVLNGAPGKTAKLRRFPFNPARFYRAQRIKAAIERARRQQWALATHHAMSWADFAELTGKTPAEVFAINRTLHRAGAAAALARMSGRKGR